MCGSCTHSFNIKSNILTLSKAPSSALYPPAVATNKSVDPAAMMGITAARNLNELSKQNGGGDKQSGTTATTKAAFSQLSD